MDRLYPERLPTSTGRVALKPSASSAPGPSFAGIDLDLREGEVLGVAGMQGHGQRELFQALFGLGRPPAARSRSGQAADRSAAHARR